MKLETKKIFKKKQKIELVNEQSYRAEKVAVDCFIFQVESSFDNEAPTSATLPSISNLI